MDYLIKYIDLLNRFVNDHKDIYIYGAGEYGRIYLQYLETIGKRPVAFITTEGTSSIEGYEIFSSKKIKRRLSDKSGIIIAMANVEERDRIRYEMMKYSDVFDVDERIHYAFCMQMFGLLNLYGKNQFKQPIVFNKILVIQIEKTFGDVIWASALIRELRRSYPNAKIDYIINSEHISLIEKCPYLDIIVDYKKTSLDSTLTKELVGEVKRFVSDNKGKFEDEYDAILLPRLLPKGPSDSWENIIITKYIKSKCIVAHCINSCRFLREQYVFYDYIFSNVIKHERVSHESFNMLQLLTAVGVDVYNANIDNRMEIWLDDDDYRFAEKQCYDKKKKYIAVAPVGSTKNRCYNSYKYGEVFRRVNSRGNYVFVLLGGKDALEASSIIESILEKRCINLAGKTTLRQAAAVISKCSLYVGADTGLMHMASSFDVPIIELSHTHKNCPPYFGSSPTRTGPWKVNAIVLQPEKGLGECKFWCASEKSHCINLISEEELESAVKKMLERCNI